MPSRDTAYTVHPALGGLDMATDPTALDPNFLITADNIEYLEGGQRKKRLGTVIYSTSTGGTVNPAFMVSSGSPVRAVEDFWKYGASLVPTQGLIAVTGASIFTSTGDGKWTAATTTSSFGAAANVQTIITLAGDNAVISDETAQPIAWNQTQSSGLVAATTGSLWPKFTASVYHLNRLFMYGLSSAPSNVNFTAANNIFDSTGTDTGTFPVAVGDGDQIKAISDPFFASLYVFKGPQKGSIWQLSGATPAGFSMVQVGYGAPAVNPRAVITTPTDVYWMSNYGVHSLQTTVKFGNVEQAFISLPIQTLWRKGIIQRNSLNSAFGFWHPTRNAVGWVVTPSGDTTSRWMLLFNYALSDTKPGGKKFWSIIKFPGFGLKSATTVLVPGVWDALRGSPLGTNSPVPFFGTDIGTVLVGDGTTLTDAGTAYTATVTTPIISRFKTKQGDVPETQEKVFRGVVTYFNPKGNYSANLTVVVDRRTQTDTVLLQGTGATLT